MQFRIKDDRHGNPVVHASTCFCFPTPNDGHGESPITDTWVAEADSLAELAESLEADLLEAGKITKAEAHAMMRIAHCINNEHAPGVGRRYSSFMPKYQVDTFGEWARETEKKVIKVEPLLPRRLSFAGGEVKPGRPASSHANCSHPVTRKDRAACRKARRANGET